MTLTLAHPGVYIVEKSKRRTHHHRCRNVDHSIHRPCPARPDRQAEARPELCGVRPNLRRPLAESTLGYAVQQFFANGGRDALICRVHKNGARASVTLAANFNLVAASEGDWGEKLRVRVENAPNLPGEAADSRFNLTVKDTATGTVERFLNLSTDPLHPRYVTKVLAEQSDLVRIAGSGTVPAASPTASGAAPAGQRPAGRPTPRRTAFQANGERWRRPRRRQHLSGKPAKRPAAASGCSTTRTSSTSCASPR